MNENTLNIGIGIAMKGAYKVQVVNPTTKEIVSDSGWHPNLILNQGMDAVVYKFLCDLFIAGVCGTGSRPNSIPGGTSQITQSSNTISMMVQSGLPSFTSPYSTYTSSIDIGDVIIDSDNSQSMVTSVVDSLNLIVDTNFTYAVGKTFTIWKTSQRGLEGELSRSANYLPGSGSGADWNSGTFTSGSTMIHRRTYDFTAAASDFNITEVGVAFISAAFAKNSLFSRVLLPVPMFVPGTFQLRLIYDLFMNYTPGGPRYVSPPIAGWANTAGTESIQNFLTTVVATSGGTDNSNASLDPGAYQAFYGDYCTMFTSDLTTPLAPFGSAVNRNSNLAYITTGQWNPYVSGSYTIYKGNTFALTDANGVNGIAFIGYGRYSTAVSLFPWNDGSQAYGFRFTTPQTKFSTQRLQLVFRFSWSRIIA